jgi:hypothetical protein
MQYLHSLRAKWNPPPSSLKFTSLHSAPAVRRFLPRCRQASGLHPFARCDDNRRFDLGNRQILAIGSEPMVGYTSPASPRPTQSPYLALLFVLQFAYHYSATFRNVVPAVLSACLCTAVLVTCHSQRGHWVLSKRQQLLLSVESVPESK